MKKLCIITLMGIMSLSLQAQIKINLKEKVKNQTQNRADNRTDQGIDKGLNKGEDAIGGLFKKKDKSGSKSKKEDKEANKNNNVSEGASNQHTDGDGSNEKPSDPHINWSNYDFVPGDEVIFEDAPSAMEENGEFPSRWDLGGGVVEIAEVDNENVIMFLSGSPEVFPYMKNPEQDWLPEIFTIEFDLYKPAESNRIFVNLYSRNKQSEEKNQEIEISDHRIMVGDIVGAFPEEKIDRENGKWMHIAIAFTKGKLKIYYDDARIINIPHYEGNPTGFSINCYFADEDHRYFMKNVRIAKGGVKYYDRVLNDGKIICNGIRFDVNKSTLKPESMGPINKIYQLMQKDANLKFSVEGHTDSDGDDSFNMNLSKERAKVVMDQLITMGISKDRLKSTGYGESKPIADNTTAEGKANNRRVEFVKF